MTLNPNDAPDGYVAVEGGGCVKRPEPATPAADQPATELDKFLALAEQAGYKTVHDVPGLMDALRATEQPAAQAVAPRALHRECATFPPEDRCEECVSAAAPAVAPPVQTAPCKGMNCGCTDGVSHSLECHAEHAAAVAGGSFVPGPDAPAAPPAVQPLTPQQIADAVEGMTVSVDVSTCDADEQHRVFGRITEAMEDPEGKHGLVLLVQDAVELNFDRLAASPLSQDQCDSLISEHWNGVGPVSRDVYTAFIRAVERAHKIGGA